MTETTPINTIQNYDWEEEHSPLPLHASMQLPGPHTGSVAGSITGFSFIQVFFHPVPFVANFANKMRTEQQCDICQCPNEHKPGIATGQVIRISSFAL